MAAAAGPSLIVPAPLTILHLRADFPDDDDYYGEPVQGGPPSPVRPHVGMTGEPPTKLVPAMRIASASAVGLLACYARALIPGIGSIRPQPACQSPQFDSEHSAWVRTYVR